VVANSPSQNDAESAEASFGPILQFDVVARLGITFEKRNRSLMGADLHRIVFAPKIRRRFGRGGVAAIG
jgi:hypothetical protein